MDQEPHERAWPLVCVLACVVVLFVAQPRVWERAAPLRSASRPGSNAADLCAEATRSADDPVPADNATPQLGSVPIPQISRSGSDPIALWCPGLDGTADGISGFQLAMSGERLASNPIDINWPELYLADLIPSTRRPVVYQEVGTPATSECSNGQAPLAEQEPASSAPVTRLPQVELGSPDGSLWATDIVPNLDAIVAQSLRPPTLPSWQSVWPEPVPLLDQLERIAWECDTGLWAREVIRQVHRLGAIGAQGSGQEVRAVMHRLDELDRAADTLATRLDDPRSASELRKAKHALSRRLAVWNQVLSAGGPRVKVHDPAEVASRPLALCLAQIDNLEGDPELVAGWQEYLQLDALERLLGQPSASDLLARQTRARLTLNRLTAPGLTADQREFLGGELFVELESELRRHAAGPIDLGSLLQHLEAYEQTGGAGEARSVAEAALLLTLSPHVNQRELGQRLQAHYRNANVRLVVTRELLERIIPERAPERRWVNDRVLGRPVHGWSVISADLGIRLIPDAERLRVALVIEGLVSSQTESTAGPATFHNHSRSTYQAISEVEIGRQGFRWHPAEVRVDNNIRLRSVRTSLDPIPLVGAVAQEIARSEHQRSQPQIARELRRKVAAQVKRQIDEQLDTRLGELNEKLEARLLEPLASLSLGPELLSAETTERRLSMRLRLAADDQLAGHTFRPWAPSDSLASCQIHESALNNVIERLGLDGRSFTLAEIRRRIADLFNWPEMFEHHPGREDVKITFAEKDAVRVRFQDGRVAVILSIARLTKAPQGWKDFRVRAYYRPQTEGPRAELVRDGVIHLAAQRSLRSQLPLRGIFSKTFSKKRPWKLTPERLLSDPRMADLAVTQLVIDDGWIGLALGPRRPETRPVVAQRDPGHVD